MGWLSREDDNIESKLDAIIRRLAENEEKLDTLLLDVETIEATEEYQLRKLDTILAILAPPTPNGFTVTETSQIQGVTQMATLQVDFQLLENGTAKLTAATVPVGSVLPAGVIPTWTSSDPVSLPVVQDLVNDPTGMTAIATGKAVVVGVIPTISAILPTGTISGQGNPIDVSIGGPTGFTVTEQ